MACHARDQPHRSGERDLVRGAAYERTRRADRQRRVARRVPGEPEHPAYGASKAGLHALGQSLAVALAPHGITVASVAPGYVATDMTVEELATPAGDLIRAQSPFNRVALPEEVAAAVVYLASPEAAWASGAVLDLNGASYLR